MADKNILEQMLEHLVNEDQAKAEELFHEYVVSKSREIYETLIESEMEDEKEEDEKEEDEKEVEEGFEDFSMEADDDMVDVEPMGGDATDDLEGDLDAEMDDDEDDEDEESTEELFQDLEDIVSELQAKFDEINGSIGDDEGDEGEMDMGDDEGEEMKDAFEPELRTVREYVEKVADGHGAEKKGKAETADSKKSVVDNMKNDMGGTTANILSGKDGAEAGSVGAGGTMKGSALSDTSAKEDNAGNINVPGGKAGKTGFTHKEAGHGAEKKGAAEQADSKQSLFRGRR